MEVGVGYGEDMSKRGKKKKKDERGGGVCVRAEMCEVEKDE
jgi:hypothetical protein